MSTMRRRPVKPRMDGQVPRRMATGRLRDAAIPAVPTVRSEEDKTATPADTSDHETEAEAAVRRMVEAAYT